MSYMFYFSRRTKNRFPHAAALLFDLDHGLDMIDSKYTSYNMVVEDILDGFAATEAYTIVKDEALRSAPDGGFVALYPEVR